MASNINLINTNPYLELNNQGQVLHFYLIRQQHIIGREATLADLVVPEEWQVVGRCQAVLCQQGGDYYIYDGNRQKASTNGLCVNHTRITPATGFLLSNGIEISIGQNPENLVVLRYYNPLKNVYNFLALEMTLLISTTNSKNQKMLSTKLKDFINQMIIVATLPIISVQEIKRHERLTTELQRISHVVVEEGVRIQQVLSQNKKLEEDSNLSQLKTP